VITLNEPALALLLESENGPVGLDLRRRAERVTVLARQKVDVIMARSSVNVAADVDFRIDPGPQAVIGIRPSGSIADYLAEKEVRESAWLVPALQEAFEV
jgi:hypothetical protein